MSYRRDLQIIANRYLKEASSDGVSAREIAAWAIDRGFWQPHRGDLINQCARELARAMREEYIEDPQGRRVRAKHAARQELEGQQRTLWADIRTADRSHIEVAFKQRRQQILGECRQLKTDVDSFNDNRALKDPIQMPFDFTVDLEEIELNEAA